MIAIRRFLLGLLIVFVLAFLGFIILAYRLVTRSLPETTGTISLSSLHQPVEVVRDNYGVPHIKAHDEHDLFLAVGYVQAQDRLWQMDLIRRAGEGRLAEILGPEAVKFDKLFRTLGFARLAQRLAQQLHHESRAALEAYAQGVNEYITSHHGNYPIEFAILGYEPEPWTVEHSLLVARLMAWELNLSWWVDLSLGELLVRVGEEHTRQIIPTYPENAPSIVSEPWQGMPHSLTRRSVRSRIGFSNEQMSRRVFEHLRGFLKINEEFRRQFQFEGVHIGSNSWVVDSFRSTSGKPILANDPHLAFGVPSKWYEMHLTCPGFNVAGVSLPGAPAIVIGHNDRIAWGLTNVMADDADFYVERVDSTNPFRYEYNGTWLPVDTATEVIRVRDEMPVSILVRSTHHGAIVSDVWPTAIPFADSLREGVVSMRWTGFEMSDEMYALHRINQARNWDEFVSGLKEFAVPGQNFIYADVDGNIGYWAAVRLPVRPAGYNSVLPLPGWSKDAEWKGFVPFEQLPHVLNPREHFIATANNKIVGDWYPYYISQLWEPPSRILRIQEMILQKEKLSVEDMKHMQFDYVSPFARELVPYILHAFDSTRVDDATLATALTYFRNWDANCTGESVPASIFCVFFTHLLQNTFRVHMDQSLFNTYVFLTNVPYRALPVLLSDSTSWWFDDPRTQTVETRDDVIRKSLQDALAELRQRLGEDIKTWQWGKLHTVTFEHLLGRRWPLDKIFNIGTFPVGGTGTTVNNGEYRFHQPYANVLGPSMRQITDLSDTKRSWSVLPTGQSGQPFSAHFNDQTPLWLEGKYHELITDWRELNRQNGDRLVLVPEAR